MAAEPWRAIFHRGTKPPWPLPPPLDRAPARWFVASDERAYWAFYLGESFGWTVVDNGGKKIASHIKTIAQVRTWAEQGTWT